jgi:hypothetical protein
MQPWTETVRVPHSAPKTTHRSRKKTRVEDQPLFPHFSENRKPPQESPSMTDTVPPISGVMTDAMWKAATFRDLVTLSVLGVTFRRRKGRVYIHSVDPDGPSGYLVDPIRQDIFRDRSVDPVAYLEDPSTGQALWTAESQTRPGHGSLVQTIWCHRTQKSLYIHLGQDKGWTRSFAFHSRTLVRDIWWMLRAQTLKTGRGFCLPDFAAGIVAVDHPSPNLVWVRAGCLSSELTHEADHVCVPYQDDNGQPKLATAWRSGYGDALQLFRVLDQSGPGQPQAHFFRHDQPIHTLLPWSDQEVCFV